MLSKVRIMISSLHWPPDVFLKRYAPSSIRFCTMRARVFAWEVAYRLLHAPWPGYARRPTLAMRMCQLTCLSVADRKDYLPAPVLVAPVLVINPSAPLPTPLATPSAPSHPDMARRRDRLHHQEFQTRMICRQRLHRS